MAADILDPPDHPYAKDVRSWAQAVLDEWMTLDQASIAESLYANRYTAVQSCHDVGKSFTAARCAAHWLETHPPGEAFVVTTAPTWKQVRLILWREIGKAHRKGRLRGRVTEAAEWKLNMGFGPDEVVATGNKPADYDQSAFQGIHARYVLVIIDEAGGVPKSIFDAADALVTNSESAMLAVGNPDDPASHFAKVCQPGSGWNVIRIDALRSPNFTLDEVKKYPRVADLMVSEGIAPSTEVIPDSVRPLLISVQWVDERIKRWGVNSPLFTSKVRGLFPKVTLDTVIEPGWVVKAQARELPADATDPRMGVDVARYGHDHSIIALREGGRIRILEDIAKGPITELVGRIKVHLVGRPNRPVVNVDDTGVGGGVTDLLLAGGYAVLPLIAGGKCQEVLPNGKPRFVDARSEWWWTIREALQGPSGTGDDGWLDLDEDDDELAAQLLAPKYHINLHGQIKVESKDEMRKRGVDSPDRADAVIYTLILQSNMSEVQRQWMETGNMLDEQLW